LQTRLNANSPQRVLINRKQHLQLQTIQLKQSLQEILQQKQSSFALLASRLQSASPLTTLHRGYSITQDSKTGQVIQVADKAQVGQAINIRLHTGNLEASVTKVKK